MADLFELSKKYHTTVAERLDASGLSSRQLEVQKRILNLAQSSSDVNDLEAKKEAENLTFKLSQSLSIDNWIVRAKAARESGDVIAEQEYEKIAKLVGESADITLLSTSIEEASKEMMPVLTKQEAIKNSFISALYKIFEYRTVHDANVNQLQKLSKDLGIHATDISKNGASFAELVKDPYYKSFVPLSDEQWKIVTETYHQMQSPSGDSQAQSALTEEVKAARQVLQGKSSELKAIEHHIETTGTRCAYLGIAPEEEPGHYTFEKVWEGGRDE